MSTTNSRTSRLLSVAAATSGGLAIVGTALVPTAAADTTLAAVWGSQGATGAFRCESVSGVRACVQLSYDTATKAVHTHSWIIDQRGGTNWTVNSGRLALVRSTVAQTPRKTTNPYPVATRAIAETVVTYTNDPGTAADRDDARTRTVTGKVGYFYAARASFTATAGTKTLSIRLTDGSWTKIK